MTNLELIMQLKRKSKEYEIALRAAFLDIHKVCSILREASAAAEQLEVNLRNGRSETKE